MHNKELKMFSKTGSVVTLDKVLVCTIDANTSAELNREIESINLDFNGTLVYGIFKNETIYRLK